LYTETPIDAGHTVRNSYWFERTNLVFVDESQVITRFAEKCTFAARFKINAYIS